MEFGDAGGVGVELNVGKADLEPAPEVRVDVFAKQFTRRSARAKKYFPDNLS